MNALEILRSLKANRNHLLWLNHERKSAAYHDGNCACEVKYAEAKMARTDPSLSIIDQADGETLAAA